MKSLSTYLKFITEAKEFKMSEVKLSKLTVSDLDKYISITKAKFLSDESMTVLNYMKKHNVKNKDIIDLDFINKQWNDGLDTGVKQACVALNKAGRIKELPMYLSDSEFSDVITEKRPLDFYVYDLRSEKGKNGIVKAFDGMVHKFAISFSKKGVCTVDDTLSAGYEGLTYAINNYGKLRSEYVRSSDVNVDTEKMAEMEAELGSKPAQIPFSAFATAHVRNAIIEYVQTLSNLVRRPKSEQNRQKAEQGYVSSQNAMSGDESVGSDSEGNARSRFDVLKGDEVQVDGGKKVDNDDAEELWKQLFKMVEGKFGKEIAELWYTRNGLNGYEQDKSAKLSPTDYYRLNNINKFLTTDKKAFKILSEIRELMQDD